MANDVIYHLECWVKAQKKVKKKPVDLQEIDVMSKVISDIELLSIVEYALDHPSGIVLDTNIINKRYQQLLIQNGMSEGDIKDSYKPYLKELINENLPKAKFLKSLRVNEPERIISDETQTGIIDSVIEKSNYEEMNLIFDVAKLVRKELLEQDQWKFEGSFSNFVVPRMLSTLLFRQGKNNQAIYVHQPKNV